MLRRVDRELLRERVQLVPGLDGVRQHRVHPGSRATDGRDAVHRVAAAEERERAGLGREQGHRVTRALENGAADSLSAAKSFEISGSYNESGDHWSIDLQVARPASEHVTVSKADVKLEAIIVGNDAYFRGNQFLSQHMGSDPLSRNLVRVAGNSWWKGSVANVPSLPDLTDGSSFRSTFLGTAVTQRSDHVSVDGIDSVRFSGPRADVYLAANPPHRVLRVRIKNGVVVDGLHGSVTLGDHSEVTANPNAGQSS